MGCAATGWRGRRSPGGSSEALALVGLEGFEARKPAQLSGGQRQRVALVRSLVKRPPLLLLDEPLGALDASLRERTGLELRALQRATGAGFVMVTHDQAEALALADQVAVLEAGRSAQYGPPQVLYDRPATRHVAELPRRGEYPGRQVAAGWGGGVQRRLPAAADAARHRLRPAAGAHPAGRPGPGGEWRHGAAEGPRLSRRRLAGGGGAAGRGGMAGCPAGRCARRPPPGAEIALAWAAESLAPLAG